jgi:secreted trypsin-like serine protease
MTLSVPSKHRVFSALGFAITLFCSALATSCGPSSQAKLNIIGGETVQSDDPLARHAAALVNRDGTVKCTVTPVGPNVFATAAHCIFGRDLKGWKIQTGTTAGDGEELPVESSIVHRDFSSGLLYSAHPETAPNDIALIQTRSPSAGTIPVPIIRGVTRLKLNVPFDITVAGYGRTSGASATSKGVLQKVRLTVTHVDDNLHEFTAQGVDGKMGCHGDSGGPAFYRDGKTEVLIGLVSRGDNSCESGTTIFTDVIDFVPFISDSLKEFNLRQQAEFPDHGSKDSTAESATSRGVR